jgi:hypothetical protein
MKHFPGGKDFDANKIRIGDRVLDEQLLSNYFISLYNLSIVLKHASMQNLPNLSHGCSRRDSGIIFFLTSKEQGRG